MNGSGLDDTQADRGASRSTASLGSGLSMPSEMEQGNNHRFETRGGRP